MNKIFVYLCLLFPIFNLFSDGFIAGSIVKTPNGPVAIEQTKGGDVVYAHGFDGYYYPKLVAFVGKKQALYLVKLIVASELIVTTVDQLFFKSPGMWAVAADLQVGDNVLAFSGYLPVEAIEIIELSSESPVELYTLAVVDLSNFYVSRREILTHNWVGVVYAGVAALATQPETYVVLEKVAEIGAYLGTAALGGYLAAKYKDKIRRWSEPEKKPSRGPVAAGGGGGRPPDDPNDSYQQYSGYKPPKNLGDWDSKEPKITRTYDNAPYHHKVGNGIKSAAPLNGQAALDNSYEIVKTSPRRIGISCNQFVVLNRTQGLVYEDGARQADTFHGHVRGWDELEQEMKNILIENGWTTRSGKIIK